LSDNKEFNSDVKKFEMKVFWIANYIARISDRHDLTMKKESHG